MVCPLTAPSPRQRQYVLMKCQNTSTRLHDTTPKKMIFSSVNGCSHSAFANLKFYRVSYKLSCTCARTVLHCAGSQEVPHIRKLQVAHTMQSFPTLTAWVPNPFMAKGHTHYCGLALRMHVEK
jgi:hypothetical protein